MSASSRSALGCGKAMRGGMRSPKYTVLSHLGHLDAMAGEASRAVPSRAVMCRAVSPAPPGPRPPPPGGSRGGAERGRARYGSVRPGTAPAQRSRCPVPTAERTPPALSPIPKDQRRDASAPGFICLGKILHNKQVVVERRGLWGFYRPQRHGPEPPRLSPARSRPRDTSGVGHLASPAGARSASPPRSLPGPSARIPRLHSARLPWKLPSRKPLRLPGDAQGAVKARPGYSRSRGEAVPGWCGAVLGAGAVPGSVAAELRPCPAVLVNRTSGAPQAQPCIIHQPGSAPPPLSHNSSPRRQLGQLPRARPEHGQPWDGTE